MENSIKRRKSFKFYYVIIFLIGSAVFGALTFALADIFGAPPLPYPVRWLIILAAFILQTVLYVKNCKYTDLINSTREYGLYEKKWQFYSIAFTAVYVSFTFGGLIMLLIFIVFIAIATKNLLIALVFAMMLLVIGIELIIGIITKIYITVKSSEILIATRKYGRTPQTVEELNKIRIPKFFHRKSISRMVKTFSASTCISIGDFKSAFEYLNSPDLNGFSFYRGCDFKLKLFAALMANDIPLAEKIFAENRNSLISQANTDSIAQHILGLWNYVHNAPEESIKWLEQALRTIQTITYPTFPIYIDLANSCLAAGNSEAARQYAEKAEALTENDYDRWRLERFREKYQNII